MGTPQFAVPMLELLHASPHQILAVVTAPDKPAGRGMTLHESEVKKCAKRLGLKTLQPTKLKDESFLEELRALQADLFVVVAFRMLPEQVWNMPPLGTINLHASLLPNYRGAAPIHWVVINGEKETGVTTFRLQHEIDTGPLIFQEQISLRDDETAGEVYIRLMELGAPLLLKTVNAMAENKFPQVEQAHFTNIKYAPKIYKDTCEIDWQQSMDTCYNLIRGLNPYPTARTYLQGKQLKIFAAQKITTIPLKAAGSFETDGKTYLYFFAADGALSITDLQLEGKKRMPIDAFLRGWKI